MTEAQAEVTPAAPVAPAIDPALKESIRGWLEAVINPLNRARGGRRTYKQLKQRLARARDTLAGLRAGVDAVTNALDGDGIEDLRRQNDYLQRFRVSYAQLAAAGHVFDTINGLQDRNTPEILATLSDAQAQYGADYFEAQLNDLANLPLCEGVESIAVVGGNKLVLTTKPITLDGKNGKKYYFGRFKLTVAAADATKQEGNGDYGVIKVSGVDNIRPADGSDYIHPHVRENGWFCIGEGAVPARSAMGRMDIASALLVVLSVVRYYNQTGDYYAVERWTSPACDSCGAYMAAPGEKLEAGQVHKLGRTPENKHICVNCGFKDQITGEVHIRRQLYVCPHCGKHTHKKNKKKSINDTDCCSACVETVNTRERAARARYKCPNCGRIHERPEGAADWNPEITSVTGKVGCNDCAGERVLRAGFAPLLLLNNENPTVTLQTGVAFIQVGDLKIRLQPVPVPCPHCGTMVQSTELRKDKFVTQVGAVFCPHCAQDGHSPVLWTRPRDMRAFILDAFSKAFGAHMNQAVSYTPLFMMTPEQLRELVTKLERTGNFMPQRGEGNYANWVENMSRIFGHPLPFEINDTLRGAFNAFYRNR